MRIHVMRVMVVMVGLGIVNGGHDPADAAAASAQRLAMMRAEWNDLDTWSRYDEGFRETELGLGLQVPGPAGVTFVAFTGRLHIQRPTTPPTEVGVQVALGKFANPTVIRRPSLAFVADAGTTRAYRLDLSERLNVDDPVPGGSAENATAMFRAADFVRLATAERLSAEVLGFESTFRADQIAALRQFGERLHLRLPEAPAGGREGQSGR